MQNDLYSPCSLMGQPCQRTTKIMRNNVSVVYNTSTPLKGVEGRSDQYRLSSWCVPSLPAPTQTTYIGKPKQAYGAFPVVAELQRGRACCETSYWKQSWWTGHIKLHPQLHPIPLTSASVDSSDHKRKHSGSSRGNCLYWTQHTLFFLSILPKQHRITIICTALTLDL